MGGAPTSAARRSTANSRRRAGHRHERPRARRCARPLQTGRYRRDPSKAGSRGAAGPSESRRDYRVTSCETGPDRDVTSSRHKQGACFNRSSRRSPACLDSPRSRRRSPALRARLCRPRHRSSDRSLWSRKGSPSSACIAFEFGSRREVHPPAFRRQSRWHRWPPCSRRGLQDHRHTRQGEGVPIAR